MRRHALGFWGAALTSLLLGGCASHHIGGDDGGADGATARGVRCGPTTCPVGEVCCNESCGICTPPGGGCIALFCDDPPPPPPPPPMRCGDRPCGPTEQCCLDCERGGLACVPAGVTCPADCPERRCDPETPCPLDMYCLFDEGCSGPGVCEPRPAGCPEDCPGVCGCDGAIYCNACQAAQLAGIAVDPVGDCSSDCGGRGYCTCSGECEPLIDLTLGCVCPCDDPFNCTGVLCDCDCGGATYLGCAPVDACASAEISCDDPSCFAELGADGCPVCVCASSGG